MIAEKQGDILTSSGSVVVPVNCVGVMGAGLARQARDAIQGLDAYYRGLCRRRLLVPGRVEPFLAAEGRYMLLFPTKKHWRDPSRIEWVRSGLDSLAQVVVERQIHRVAVPRIGCGLGRLAWADVRREVEDRLGRLSAVVEVWA